MTLSRSLLSLLHFWHFGKHHFRRVSVQWMILQAPLMAYHFIEWTVWMRLSTWTCHDSPYGGKGLQAAGRSRSAGPLCDTRAAQWETRACLNCLFRMFTMHSFQVCPAGVHLVLILGRPTVRSWNLCFWKCKLATSLRLLECRRPRGKHGNFHWRSLVLEIITAELITYRTIFPVSPITFETIKVEVCLFHSLSQQRWVGSLHYGGCLTLSSFSGMMQTQCTVGSTDTSFDKGTSGHVWYYPSEGGQEKSRFRCSFWAFYYMNDD